MSCLMKYKWVKIPRDLIPEGRGLLLDYIRAYAAAAITKGTIRYCQYENEVEEGMWAGGRVGLKSILNAGSTADALERLQRLASFGILTYEYAPDTKLLSYRISEAWRIKNKKTALPVKCGNTFGFIRVPRNVPNRLVAQGYVFEEADAWIDLWCHTVSGDNGNVFSFLQPCVQINSTEPALTLEMFARRWNWSRAKAKRFFAKNAAYFRLCKLPGSYGCVIFNPGYADSKGEEHPSDEQIRAVCRHLQKYGKNRRSVMTDRAHFCILINKYTKKLIAAAFSENRGTLSFIYTYISLLKSELTERVNDCGRTYSIKDSPYLKEGGKMKYTWIVGEEQRKVVFYGSTGLKKDAFERILKSRFPDHKNDYFDF